MNGNSVRWGKKYFVLGRIEQPRQDKNLLYQQDQPNEPTKERPLSFVLFESPFTPVPTVSRCHPSLVSLVHTMDKITYLHPQRSKKLQNFSPAWSPSFGQHVCWIKGTWKADLAHDGSAQRAYRTACSVKKCEPQSNRAAQIQDVYQTARQDTAVQVGDLVRPCLPSHTQRV